VIQKLQYRPKDTSVSDPKDHPGADGDIWTKVLWHSVIKLPTLGAINQNTNERRHEVKSRFLD
jgi:hypothetical protein